MTESLKNKEYEKNTSLNTSLNVEFESEIPDDIYHDPDDSPHISFEEIDLKFKMPSPRVENIGYDDFYGTDIRPQGFQIPSSLWFKPVLVWYVKMQISNTKYTFSAISQHKK